MDSLIGYRTIIAALLQLVVSFGILSQSDASGLTDALFGIVSGVMFLITVYFKLRANVREMGLRFQMRRLMESGEGKGTARVE